MYTPQQLSSLYRDVEQRLAGLRGVRGVGLAWGNPLVLTGSVTILLSGHPPNASNESDVSWDRVSTDYLQNLGVALVRGRMFTSADNETAAPVAVVNETFVKRFSRTMKMRSITTSVSSGRRMRGHSASSASYDAKFAYSGLAKPARPVFFVPLAQRVEYKSDQGNAKLLEGCRILSGSCSSPTLLRPAILSHLLRRTLAKRSKPDDPVRENDAATYRLVVESRSVVAELAQLFHLLPSCWLQLAFTA
jgi:hypothetical protein